MVPTNSIPLHGIIPEHTDTNNADNSPSIITQAYLLVAAFLKHQGHVSLANQLLEEQSPYLCLPPSFTWEGELTSRPPTELVAELQRADYSLPALLQSLVTRSLRSQEGQPDILAHIAQQIRKLVRVKYNVAACAGLTSRVAEARSLHQSSLDFVYQILLPWTLPSDWWAEALLSTSATRYHHLKTITGHRLPAYCVLFDRADRRLLTGGDDGLVKIWCAHTGYLLYSLRGHSNCISDMSVDTSNTILAVGSIDGYISFWNLVSGKHLFTLNAFSPILTLEFQPMEGPAPEVVLMSTCSDGYAKFWAINLQQRTASPTPIKFHCKSLARDEIRCASFSPAGLRFVTGATDGIVRLIRVPTLEEIKGNHSPAMVVPCVYFLEDHLGYVNSVHYRADGKRFLTSSWDGSIREWWWQEPAPGSDPQWKSRAFEVATALGSPGIDARGRPRKVTIVSYCCGDKGAVCAVNQTHELIHFPLEGGKPTVLPYHEGEVYILTAHPLDDRILLSAGCDGKAALWDMSRIVKVFEFSLPNTRFLDGGFSQDGSMVTLVDDLGRVSLFGCGISPSSYEKTPMSQFYPTDWNELIFDTNRMAIDSITQRPADSINRDQIVSIEKEPYERYLLCDPRYAEGIPIIGDLIVAEKQSELFKQQKINEQSILKREYQVTPPGTLPKHTRSRRRRLLFGSDVEEEEEAEPGLLVRQENLTADEAEPLLYAASETEAELSVIATDEAPGSPYNLRRSNRALVTATEATRRVAAQAQRARHHHRLRELAGRRSNRMTIASENRFIEDDELYRPSLEDDDTIRARRGSRRGRRRRPHVAEDEEEDQDQDEGHSDTDKVMGPTEPPSWLARKERQLFPYLPQLYDVVAYLPDGHRAFLRAQSTPPPEFPLPEIPFDHQNEAVLFGQVVEVDFYVGPPVWCQVQLLLLEAREAQELLPSPAPTARNNRDRISIAFYDQPGQADFLIPFCRYTWSVARPNRYRMGEVVRVRYGGDEVYEARIRRIKVGPNRIPNNPWQCYQVEWLSLEDDPEWASPWELETILEEDAPERIPYECHEMLEEAVRLNLLQGVERISREPMAMAFRKPVDPSLVPDYLSIVAYPIDLSLIKTRLRLNYYRRLEAFEWDCKLIHTNAYLYNQPDSELVEDADKLVKALLLLARQADRQSRRTSRATTTTGSNEPPPIVARPLAASRAALEREARARRRASLNLRQSSPPSSAFDEPPVHSSITRQLQRRRVPLTLTDAVSMISSTVGSSPLRRKRKRRRSTLYKGGRDAISDKSDVYEMEEEEGDDGDGDNVIIGKQNVPKRRDTHQESRQVVGSSLRNDSISGRTRRQLRILDESISDTALEEDEISKEVSDNSVASPRITQRSSRDGTRYSLRNRPPKRRYIQDSFIEDEDEGPSQSQSTSYGINTLRKSARLHS